MSFRTKQDQVAEILRERIIVGDYQRGEKLKQADIADELGVSITPVREALNILEAEGYVVGVSHKGLVVPLVVPEQTREVFELRVLLEAELTTHAIARLTARDIADLKQFQGKVVEAIAGDDQHAVRTANYRFHFTLYELAERPQTLKFVRVLWAKYPFTSQDAVLRRNERMKNEHDLFLSKLEAGEADGAVQAMVDHIKSGWRELTEKGPPSTGAQQTAKGRRTAAF